MAITPENYWPLESTIQKTFTNLNVGSGYEHFGILSVNPLDGHMIMVYRKGTAYVGSIGSIYIRHSGDGGANWSNETLVLSETNVDLRNIFGGYVSNGRLIVFYSRYQNSTTWLSISYISSTNNGDSWSSPQSAYNQPGNTAFSPYGHVVDFGTGLLYQTWYEVDGSTYLLRFSKSYDGGGTFSPVNIKTIYSSTNPFTEPSMVNLGGGCLLVLARINGGTCFAQFRSTDFGNNWTGPEYTNFETWTNGQNMPWLSFINYQGVGIVACYYTRRDASPYKIKVVFGLASDIINNGISGWKSATLKEVCPSTSGYRSGYQSFYHPDFQLKGVGLYFDCSAVSSYPKIIYTPVSGLMDILSELMP